MINENEIITAYKERMVEAKEVVLDGVAANIMIRLMGTIIERYAVLDRHARVYGHLSEAQQAIVDAVGRRFARDLEDGRGYLPAIEVEEAE